jgi:hypothetical protein
VRFPFRRRNRLEDDPRARALFAAALRLYEELEPDDVLVTVVINAMSGRHLVSYGLHAAEADVRRMVVDLDDEEAIARGEVTEVIVPDGPP